jgi:hypothetical protein
MYIIQIKLMNLFNNDLPGGKQMTKGDKKNKKTTVISLLVISHKS